MLENIHTPDNEPTKPLEESDFPVADALLEQLDEQGEEQSLQARQAELYQAYKRGELSYDQYDQEADYVGLKLHSLQQRSQHSLEIINNNGRPLSRRQKIARAVFGHSHKA